MGRMTRKKAAEIAENLHVDEDVLLELSSDELAIQTDLKGTTPKSADRPILGEITPNSAEGKTQPGEEHEEQQVRKSTHGKKGKKVGAKAKKNDLAASTGSQPDAFHSAQNVLPDACEPTPAPANERIVEDSTNVVSQLAVQDTAQHPNTPSAAARLSRSQMKRDTEIESEPKSLIDSIGQEAECETMKEEAYQDTNIEGETGDPFGSTPISEPQSAFHAPVSPPPSALPNVIAHLRTETPAKRSASNKENIEPEATMSTPQASNYDQLEDAVVTGTPSRSVQPSPRPEDSIVALDQLDDAVESIKKDIPEVQSSPEKPKKASTPPKKAAPVVRTTKAAAARMSMALEKKAAADAPAPKGPRMSIALGRASSVREMSASSRAAKRISSISSVKPEAVGNGDKKEAVIPRSKPRPISMSFPTPPPPSKSTKAPTQSTFQLSGDAVAARLRAAREARQQKPAHEEEKKPAFKARPAPSALSKAPAVRQTNASKARESVMNGQEFKMPVTAASASAAHRRANSVATTQPSASTSRVALGSSTTSRLAALSEKPSVRPRHSTSMANISKVRASTGGTTTSVIGQRVTSTSSNTSTSGKGTSKGREVFNRAALAKADADKAKQEREGAAKKARADAAERSRMLSREFAEKQRAKKMAAASAKVEQGAVAGVGA